MPQSESHTIKLQRQTGMLWELLSRTSDDIIGDLIAMKSEEEVKANFPEDYAEWLQEQN